ncbi:MAG: phosphoglucomutase/phosphomannomutase family protein [Oscillospiraceae bacterium]|nr:phosphoglucomutase/phosphomannomutase family protein [Oscillospiraceae bacterium]
MIKFGTGGWRAIIADDFTKDNIRLLSAGLCRLMQKEGYAGAEIVMGYDRRFLSKESVHWAAEVLAGYGMHPCIIDRSVPTPQIMFVVRERGCPYGMAVTASHNPAIYNGIKLFTAGGRDADVTVTGKIEAEIEQLEGTEIPFVDYDTAIAQGMIREIPPSHNYIDSILSAVNVEAIKNAHLRIALDPMYGVGQTSMSMVLMTCQCELEVIHGNHDTLFGGRLPAPEESSVAALSAVVTDRHRCHLGIATDGDADRIGVVDDQGQYVHPNKLLVLLYYYLLKYRGWTGPCVRNNSTTHMLDRVAAGLGQTCYEVPVGFKHISAKMTETDAVIGGESSGGLTVRGHIAGKDGIYAAALLAEMIAVTGKSIPELYAEICAQYGELMSAAADFTMTAKRKEELQKLLFCDLALPEFGCEVDHISREDGCKVYFRDGSWVICRFSGTEPLLRMASEAETKAKAENYIAVWKSFLEL